MHEQEQNPQTRGLTLTRDGHWLHDGQRVVHARLCALLTRSIARDSGGSLIVTTGRDVLPFRAEDAPLQIRALEGNEGLVGDGIRVRLGPLFIDEEGRVRTPVHHPRGAFWALLSRGATHELTTRMDEHGRVSFPKGPQELTPTQTMKGSTDWSGVPPPEAWAQQE